MELTISPEMLQNDETVTKKQNKSDRMLRKYRTVQNKPEKQNLQEFWRASLPSPPSPHEIVCLFCKASICNQNVAKV